MAILSSRDHPLSESYFPESSIILRTFWRAFWQSAWFGIVALSVFRAVSILPSTICQSLGDRGLSPASALSQASSRSLIRVFPPERSFFSTRESVSVTMTRNDERSPSLWVETVCLVVDCELLVDGFWSVQPLKRNVIIKKLQEIERIFIYSMIMEVKNYCFLWRELYFTWA